MQTHGPRYIERLRTWHKSRCALHDYLFYNVVALMHSSRKKKIFSVIHYQTHVDNIAIWRPEDEFLQTYSPIS